jgi:hypothetical protein
MLIVSFLACPRSAGASDGPDEEPQNPRTLEIRPVAGWAFVPHSIAGAFIGADATVRLHRRWALGADAAWYSPFESEPQAWIARYPVNRTSWSASLDAAFFPWMTARAAPADGSLEVFVLLGAGLIATRPVPVVDLSRHFDDSVLLQLGAGVGGRLYVNRWLALTLELRDFVHFDRVENAQIASGNGAFSASNPNTWYAPDNRLTNCVELRLGASFFPF